MIWINFDDDTLLNLEWLSSIEKDTGYARTYLIVAYNDSLNKTHKISFNSKEERDKQFDKIKKELDIR